ncbi:uncharacterized protein LAJ45_07043 [Morchella importuna]|uniref:uncharacterized protein n=1 Tax=Morchella importuna TaxID=1174673 RepID=UPI001E8E2A0F|nr:uncharacterized protein LAJ45_07043 [Morchella importuna]KAH8149067.1 hypothetical protein LAJ45_07043 [Morchella importuna]
MAALVDHASQPQSQPQRNAKSKTAIVNGETGGDMGHTACNDHGNSESPCSNTTPPLPIPTVPAPVANKKGGGVGVGVGPKPKKTLDPSEVRIAIVYGKDDFVAPAIVLVNSLLAAKISQLESDASMEEEEEKAISRAVRKANKELAELVSGRDDHLAKVDAIQTKYSELLHEMKRLERDHAKARKRADQLQKERDQSRSEMQKAVTVKHKLESLCRELQKENKRIKDDNKKHAEKEQQKREELSNKFESTLMDIKSRIEEENDGGSRKVNMEADELFKAKFKSLVDQYELRELHFTSLLKTKELEVQWNLSRYEQQKKLAEQESLRAKALHQQVSTFSQTEAELRSQLNIYVEKFKQVEDTLNNSNDLFLTFRKEMEEMSKKTKRLEKENLTLSRKSETTNRNLLEMAEERTRHQKELETLKKKNIKLENLCRALQAERTTLENRLRHGDDGDDLLEDSDGDSDEYEDSADGYDEEGSEEGSEEDVGEDTDDEPEEIPQQEATHVEFRTGMVGSVGTVGTPGGGSEWDMATLPYYSDTRNAFPLSLM